MAALTITVSIIDLGANAVNSSTKIDSRSFTYPSVYRASSRFSLDIVLSCVGGVVLTQVLGRPLISVSLLFLSTLVFSRLFIMRWITITRKSSDPLAALLRGECVMGACYSASLLGFYFSEEAFIGIISVLLTFQMLLIRNSFGGPAIFSAMWTGRAKQYSSSSLLFFIQASISTIKNNLTGVLLTGSNVKLDELLSANRLGQIYLVVSGGANSLIPYRIRHEGRVIKLDSYSLFMFSTILVFSAIPMFMPEAVIFLMSRLYGYEVYHISSSALLVFMLLSLSAPLCTNLISRGLILSNMIVDILLISTAIFFARY